MPIVNVGDRATVPTSVNARLACSANVPDGSVRTAPVGSVVVSAGGGAAGDGRGVPDIVGVAWRMGPSVGVGVAVRARAVSTAGAEGAGVAGWLPHPATRAAASIRAPRERRISPPTSAVAQQLRGPVEPRPAEDMPPDPRDKSRLYRLARRVHAGGSVTVLPPRAMQLGERICPIRYRQEALVAGGIVGLPSVPEGG